MNHAGEKFLSYDNIKNIILLSVFGFTIAVSQQTAIPGVFTRLGFGARAMGMGNALTAVRTGELSGFYNPAVLPFSTARNVSMSYGVLSLDRNLNTLFYSQPIDTNAGISLGVLNSRVIDIDGRDNDGFHTETYSTSENLFLLSFGLKIKKIVIGITPKLYYNYLFKKFSATAFGFDFGFLYPASRNLTFTFVLKDFKAKYKWDSSVLYDQLGNSTTDDFWVRKIIGASYTIDGIGLVSGEFESTNGTKIVRLGAEAVVNEYFILRGGLDGLNLKDSKQAHPSFGCTIYTGYSEYQPALNYAFVIEPYGVFSMHVISLSVKL